MGDEQETKYCSNCKRDIAAVNYVMHEVHCARNIVLCKKCDEPVPRSELEEHEHDEHRLVPCELCKKQFEVSQIEQHKEDDCDKRLVHCAYCEVECPRDGLQAHMDFCGTRTEQCPQCQQFIMIKDQTKHEESNCTYPPRPDPEPSSSNTTNPIPPNPYEHDFGLGHARGDVSFRSSELMRMMDAPHASFGRPMPREFGTASRAPVTRSRAMPPRISSLGRSSMASTSTSGPATSGASSSSRSNIKPRAPLHGQKRNSWSKDTNLTRVQIAQKSNLRPTNQAELPPLYGHNESQSSESSRPKRESGPSNADEEADRLLAMQLSNQLGSTFDGGDPFSSTTGAAGSSNFFPAENISPYFEETESTGEVLPCEFCGQQFPVEELIQHSSGCTEAPSDLFTKTDRWYMKDDEDQQSSSHNENRNTSPVEFDPPSDDEFHPSAFAVSNDFSHGIEGFENDGESMIPCEFCSDLFPIDMLFMHQPDCPMNRTKTPLPPKTSTNHTSSANRGSHVPEPGRTGSSARVQRTLNTFMNDPTDPPLYLHGSASNRLEPGASRGAFGAASSRPSVATGYEPSFAPAASSTRTPSRTKPRLVPSTTMNGDGLQEASGRRPRVNNHSLKYSDRNRGTRPNRDP